MKYYFGQFVFTKDNLVNNENLFNNKNIQCVAIGIQGPSGIRFQFNEDETEWIELGRSGIYEIDLHNETTINYLRFNNNNSLNDEQKIIVDYKYAKAEERSAN